ncbi:MAG: hypothetical protein OHK0021_14680 [Bryobacter sp.]
MERGRSLLLPLGLLFLLTACAKDPAPPVKPSPTVRVPEYTAAHVVPSGMRQAGPLAPGRIATLYGNFLGPQTPCSAQAHPQLRGSPHPARPVQAELETAHFPTGLCGVALMVDGHPAGLLYVSAGQVNFQVPQEIVVSRPVPVQLRHQDAWGPSIEVALGWKDTPPAAELARQLESALASLN